MMDNEAILRSLAVREPGAAAEATAEQELLKYVLFTIGERAYALPADRVREISFDNELHYVPFLPPYVRGYANRHGQPFTVIDLAQMFDGLGLDSSTLLILAVEGDQLALLISDVDEIVKLPRSAIHTLASEEESARFFSHSVTAKEGDVFVLNVLTLLERLERDVERI